MTDLDPVSAMFGYVVGAISVGLLMAIALDGLPSRRRKP